MRPRHAIPALAAAICAAWADAADVGIAEPRAVWRGPEVTLLGGPSRDGRYLSAVDPRTRNLALREVAGGGIRLLTVKPAGSREFAYFSAISPDSRRVAYAWFNQEGFYELRVVDINGSNSRVLYRNQEAGFVQPCGWSPDSKQILTLLFRSDNISQIALIPSEGGVPRVLRSLNWVYPKRMDLSPDGRYIVYDSFAGDTPGDRTLYLLSVDGAKERKLVNLPGNHLFPLWTPDGKHIVYASDRGGTMDAWELDVEEGAPRGAPRLLRRDLGRFLPMGITAAGELFFGLRAGGSDVFVTALGAAASEARRASSRYPGRNSGPAWSTDGTMLAYLSRRGSENFGQESRAIVVRSLDSGEERELLPKLAHIERARWSPDGKTLLVSGSDSKGRGGIYVVDARSGVARELVTEAGAPFRGFDAAWSPDGRWLYYIRGGQLRRREASGGGESTLYRADDLGPLAVSLDGKQIAAGLGGKAILVLTAAGGDARTLPFEGITELEWGPDLIAGKDAELWRIPVDGTAPARIVSPGNRAPGFTLHPDGKRIAMTAGDARSEVWVLPVR